jgi:hypothetical protein
MSRSRNLQTTMRHDVLVTQLRRLLTRPRPARVTGTAGLVELLAAQTAYVTQRTVIEYCRARSGTNWDKLFAEPSFVAQLEICRWDGYASVLAEIAELALIRLRRDGTADPAAYVAGLVQVAQAALVRHPVPVHRASWRDAESALERHLMRALIAAPRPVHLVGFQSAAALFELLPIHADLRRQDQEWFQNSLRFAICGAFEEISRRVDVAALEAALQEAGAAQGAEPPPLNAP